MSRESIVKFYGEVDKNANLKREFDGLRERTEKGQITNKESIAKGIVSIAREQGFEFTEDELLSYMREVQSTLSEEEVQNVSGGLSARAAGIGLMGTLMLSFAAATAFNIADFNKASENNTTQEVTLDNEKEEDSVGKDAENASSQEKQSESSTTKKAKNLKSSLQKRPAQSVAQGRSVTPQSKLGRGVVDGEVRAPILENSDENVDPNASTTENGEVRASAPSITINRRSSAPRRANSTSAITRENGNNSKLERTNSTPVLGKLDPNAPDPFAGIDLNAIERAGESTGEKTDNSGGWTGFGSGSSAFPGTGGFNWGSSGGTSRSSSADGSSEDTKVASDAMAGILARAKTNDSGQKVPDTEDMKAAITKDKIKHTNWFHNYDLEVTIDSIEFGNVLDGVLLNDDLIEHIATTYGISVDKIDSIRMKDAKGGVINLFYDPEDDTNYKNIMYGVIVYDNVAEFNHKLIGLGRKVIEKTVAQVNANKDKTQAESRLAELKAQRDALEGEESVKVYNAIESIDWNWLGSDWDLTVRIKKGENIPDRLTDEVVAAIRKKMRDAYGKVVDLTKLNSVTFRNARGEEKTLVYDRRVVNEHMLELYEYRKIQKQISDQEAVVRRADAALQKANRELQAARDAAQKEKR